MLEDKSLELVAANRKSLVKRGIDFAIFTATETGLKKSILDATHPVRAVFESTGFHYYSNQEQGVENKILTDAYFVTSRGLEKTRVSLYRPNTKKGDPRMWFTGLGSFAAAGDQLAVVMDDGIPHLINFSRDVIDAVGLVGMSQAVKESRVVYDASKLGVDSGICGIFTFCDQLSEKYNSKAKELLERLKTLALNGPLKAVIAGDTAVGMTVEAALGIEANSSRQPDYKGIELKASRKTFRRPNRATLFAQVAEWEKSPLKSSREILDAFGYQRDEDFKLYCTVSAKVENSQGLKFELRNDNSLLVEVHSSIGDVAVWTEKLLIERLKEKHAETFWIKAEVEVVDDIEYFHLKSVTHTRFPLQNQLMLLLADGTITMDHLIKRSGKTGRVSEKGPLFKLLPKAIPLLFPEPKVYSLDC